MSGNQFVVLSGNHAEFLSYVRFVFELFESYRKYIYFSPIKNIYISLQSILTK